ncbi:hypothetical protein Q5752_001944 [Cryptotrichosporon argae]
MPLPEPHGPPRFALAPSDPTPILPLPPSLTFETESRLSSELELNRQTRQLATEAALADALQQESFAVERRGVREALGTWRRKSGDKGKGKAGGAPTTAFATPPQAWELYRAIDQRDVDFVMRVRDHAFDLLLQKHGGDFPIIYASRLGKGHRVVVILLIGALSRFVNHLEDADFDRRETQRTLKMLRINLKLAIDQSLSTSPSLLSSYLQVLIMSEGDAFLHKATHDVSLILRADPAAAGLPSTTGADVNGDRPRPVAEAERLVRSFCTKELRGVEGGVQGVEEYIANAALDLVLRAAWSTAASQVGGEELPTYTFARDLRTYQAFVEAADGADMSKASGRVRHIVNVLRELAGDTKQNVRGRLRAVRAALDGA